MPEVNFYKKRCQRFFFYKYPKKLATFHRKIIIIFVISNQNSSQSSWKLNYLLFGTAFISFLYCLVAFLLILQIFILNENFLTVDGRLEDILVRPELGIFSPGITIISSYLIISSFLFDFFGFFLKPIFFIIAFIFLLLGFLKFRIFMGIKKGRKKYFILNIIFLTFYFLISIIFFIGSEFPGLIIPLFSTFFFASLIFISFKIYPHKKSVE